MLLVWRFFYHLAHYTLLFWLKSAKWFKCINVNNWNQLSFLPCVLEITADRFPDLCWSHDSAGAVCLPLCRSVCLSIFWPGTLSISFVFFHLETFTSSTVTFPFFFCLFGWHTAQSNYKCTYRYLCHISVCLRSFHLFTVLLQFHIVKNRCSM